MSQQQPIVAVIDDDHSVREALDGLFRSVGLGVETYESTDKYLTSRRDDQPGCLVLDVRLPGRSGLEFQEELVRREIKTPVVFISGHADVAMSVRAMKVGAVEFLTKPVRDQDLLDAVQHAIDCDKQRRTAEDSARAVRANLANLTTREHEVLRLVVSGARNKEIAAKLNISEATVKLHRSHVMQKLGAPSLVALIRITDSPMASEPRPFV